VLVPTMRVAAWRERAHGVCAANAQLTLFRMQITVENLQKKPPLGSQAYSLEVFRPIDGKL